MKIAPEPPAAESIRPQEVVKRIVETKENDAWSELKETILGSVDTKLPPGK